MAFTSSVSSSSVAPIRAGGKKAKLSFMASQALAKQKSFEKKAPHYRVPLQDLAVFTSQLAALLTAGLPLVASLEALEDQTQNPIFRIIIRQVRIDISSGNSFSSAVKKFPKGFNTLFISMVEAGEASGALAEILGKVAAYFEATVKLTKKVKSALTYPAAVMGLAVVLVNVLLIFVIPVFGEMFSSFGSKLPAPTQMLLDVSDFLKSYIIFIIIGGFGLWKLWCKFVETPRGRAFRDTMLLRAPVFGALIHKITLSRFCRTYATLARSGVPILRNLEITAAACDRVQVDIACQQISRHISSGGQISEILGQNNYFPPMMKHMVKAGETTGNVDGMMNKIADFLDTECDATVGALTSLLEPILICFLGVVIGGIVMAMFLPIFQLSSVVGG